MKKLDKLVEICKAYKNREFGAEEFQSRVTTAYIPESISKTFLNSLIEFDNEIEKILFCKNYQSQFNEACKAADKLLEAIQNEKLSANEKQMQM